MSWEQCWQCHKEHVSYHVGTTRICKWCYARRIFGDNAACESAYRAQPKCRLCNQPYLDAGDFAWHYINGLLSKRVSEVIVCTRCGDVDDCLCVNPDMVHKSCWGNGRTEK